MIQSLSESSTLEPMKLWGDIFHLNHCSLYLLITHQDYSKEILRNANKGFYLEMFTAEFIG